VYFYCTKHGQNPTHTTEKCFTLKKCAEKAKGASSSGLTRKSFRKEINILAKLRPKKKILEMFAVVLQQEHKKLTSKNTKKIKRSIILDESSDSKNKDMSVEQMSINKTDTDNSPSKILTDETDENRTYESRIENLGAITNEELHQPVVTNTSKEEFHGYTNECYVTAATLFNPSK
jgi:hypothetical protein